MPDLDLQLTDIARDLLMTVLVLAGPVLMCGLIVGVCVSVFQALTSVQEQTLSLVPKMFAVIMVTLILLAPAIGILRDYAVRMIGQMVSFGLS